MAAFAVAPLQEVIASGAEVEPLLTSLEIGASIDAARAVLAKSATSSVAWLRRDEPQALARGLIRSGLLEELNRSGTAGQPGLAGIVELATVERPDGRRHALAFGPRLLFVLASIPVPIDSSEDGPGAWSPRRLHRLPDALDELSRVSGPLVPAAKDARGNVTAWTAKSRKRVLHARYLPERDELRVLITGR